MAYSDLDGFSSVSSALRQAKSLVQKCKQNNIKLTVAESCTGGLVSAAITDIPGASVVFDRGVITYSNKSKTELLDVSEGLIAKYGAVSAEVAAAMAEGALKNSQATHAVSITGIAGPDGGSAEKPVGLVYIGIAGISEKPSFYKNNFVGTRKEIREQVVIKVLELLGNIV